MAQRRRRDDDLAFEIEFFERLIERHPAFVEPLMQLGEAYTRAGRYVDGLGVDRRLTKLRPKDPIAWYNLACSYALLNRSDESLEALSRAIALGYDDFSYLMKDPDLATVRQSPKLRLLLEQRLGQQQPS